MRMSSQNKKASAQHFKQAETLSKRADRSAFEVRDRDFGFGARRRGGEDAQRAIAGLRRHEPEQRIERHTLRCERVRGGTEQSKQRKRGDDSAKVEKAASAEQGTQLTQNNNSPR